MTKFFLSFAALSALASPLLAEPVAVTSRNVAISDLDLASPAGQRAFDARIHRAVVDLCGEASDVDLVGKNAVRECHETSLAEAYRQRDQRLAQNSTRGILLAAR